MLSHEYAMPEWDIVESLRNHARDRDIDAWMNCGDAADEIERLREENQELKLQYLSDQGQWIEETGRLRAALQDIMVLSNNRSPHPMSQEADYFRIAHAALGEKEE